MHLFHDIPQWLHYHEFTYALVVTAALIVLAAITYWVACICLRTSVRRFILRDPVIHRKDILVTRRIALVISAIVFALGLKAVHGLPEWLANALGLVSAIFCTLSVAVLLFELLDTVNAYWIRKSKSDSRSIKGYVQISKIIIAALSGILILAILTGRPPILIISSFGAAAAVLIFVFQHTLVSFVANIQISAARAININDWIQMPGGMVDGEVMDIALHTVRVRNWDNTMARVPMRSFITEPWINWQPVFRGERGRRIKRSFFVDQNSIKFASEDMLMRLRATFKHHENVHTGDEQSPAELFAMTSSQLREEGVTNLGLLRAHILHYLRRHKDIVKDMFIVVRYLEPTAEGVPMEIYCFSRHPNFADYERIQSQITEYIYAVAGDFNITLFQTPSGQDWRESRR